ncbi:DUF6538 domain-containing protein [Bosea sp. RAC05]|uniref:DUF6538 domain-containing protein n=1 Tax=Bosea sp. RAC05 TaxID=1842539 RepID=UPI003FA48AF1
MHRFDRACLSRRSHVFWIRKAVPVELAASLGKTDVRRSLRTKSPLVARQRARTVLIVIEEAFETLRALRLPPEARTAFDAIVNHIGRSRPHGRQMGPASEVSHAAAVPDPARPDSDRLS